MVVQWRVVGEDPLEDLGFAAHVELRRRLVEQDDAGAHPDRAERARQRDALPLTAGEIGAVLVAARQRWCRGAPGSRRPRLRSASTHHIVGRAAGATLSRSGSSRRMKSWNTAVRRDRHDDQIELAHVDSVDLDRAALRVVQPAQQLGQRRLAGAVLSDDRQRRTRRNGQVEAVEHAGAARIGKRDVAEADLARGQAVAGRVPEAS